MHAEAAGDGPAVEVIVEDGLWERPGADWDALAGRLAADADARLPETPPGAIAVLLTGDDHMRQLNRDFRGKDAATNVLSFPAPPRTGSLGDIALAAGVCAREAEAQGKRFEDHAAHLILHGILHLYGLDHETGEAEAEHMETLEREILAGIGVTDPYAEELVHG